MNELPKHPFFEALLATPWHTFKPEQRMAYRRQFMRNYHFKEKWPIEKFLIELPKELHQYRQVVIDWILEYIVEKIPDYIMYLRNEDGSFCKPSDAVRDRLKSEHPLVKEYLQN